MSDRNMAENALTYCTFLGHIEVAKVLVGLLFDLNKAENVISCLSVRYAKMGLSREMILFLSTEKELIFFKD